MSAGFTLILDPAHTREDASETADCADGRRSSQIPQQELMHEVIDHGSRGRGTDKPKFLRRK
jgi:hypothetical protein